VEIWFALGDDLRHAFLAVILIRAEDFPPILLNFSNIICSSPMSTAAPNSALKRLRGGMPEAPKSKGRCPTAAGGPRHTPSKTMIRFSGGPPTFDINVYTHPTATRLFGEVKVLFRSLENI
jgi:hypothetical protein